MEFSVVLFLSMLFFVPIVTDSFKMIVKEIIAVGDTT